MSNLEYVTTNLNEAIQAYRNAKSRDSEFLEHGVRQIENLFVQYAIETAVDSNSITDQFTAARIAGIAEAQLASAKMLMDVGHYEVDDYDAMRVKIDETIDRTTYKAGVASCSLK